MTAPSKRLIKPRIYKGFTIKGYTKFISYNSNSVYTSIGAYKSNKLVYNVVRYNKSPVEVLRLVRNHIDKVTKSKYKNIRGKYKMSKCKLKSKGKKFNLMAPYVNLSREGKTNPVRRKR